MSVDLRLFVDASKTIPISRGWAEIDRNYLSFVSPLDIDEVTVAGLQVRMGAFKLAENEDVRAQLEYHPLKGRPEPLCRLEWRPLSPHSNKGRGPLELRFKQFRQTHIHPFDLNWDASQNRLLSPNLPIAIPIQDVDSYDKFLDLCARHLKIRNMSIVPAPPWEARML